ncbi:MAG: 4'-phosphopantetheinyl transferase superfamily protein [Oscillospiraceae bacterium]|nr:4'-phosphopantetheinyl transferase superfamily protein [Oscillospiraceae bacterium]
MLYLAYCPVENTTPSAAAHTLLARLYSRAYGEAMPPLVKESGGKPGFLGGRFCSMTHTKRSAFCALSDQPVGIDAEEINRKVMPGLARRLFSTIERETAPSTSEEMLRYWTLKEAYLKYTGEGLRRDLRELTFLFADGTPKLLGSELHFQQMEIFGCFLAICTPEPYFAPANHILAL